MEDQIDASGLVSNTDSLDAMTKIVAKNAGYTAFSLVVLIACWVQLHGMLWVDTTLSLGDGLLYIMLLLAAFAGGIGFITGTYNTVKEALLLIVGVTHKTGSNK